MTTIVSGIQHGYQYSLRLLKQLVITDFKLRYKGSFLGYIWTVLKPLALFAVMYVVFVNFLKFGQGEPHFAVAMLLGIVLWNYFVEVTMNGMSAIVSKGDLMRKLSFPRYVLVVAGSFSAVINLAINLVVVAILMVINGVVLTPYAFLIIPVILEIFVLALSVAFLLATLYVKLRDINYIWELLLQIGFYATPVFYPISMVVKYSEDIAKLVLLTPMAQIIEDARFALVDQSYLTTWQMFDGGPYAFIPLAIVAGLLIVSVVIFRRASPHFAEDI